jgi:hypothetical protein
LESFGRNAQPCLPGVAPRAKKKTCVPLEQQREDVVDALRQWAAEQLKIDPDRVVFIDETWAKTNMTRKCGRGERGTRLVESVPYVRWETMTLLGAMRSTGFVAPLCIDGAFTVRCSKPGSSSTW